MFTTFLTKKHDFTRENLPIVNSSDRESVSLGSEFSREEL